ncbi:Polyamine N-acetyltransferase 1 [Cytospora mali]|uniref:Polyamine N-acetyltransferase 1 n=1 Tax=Cytospora mali TaxID=578113 RepID=A0A194UPZ9_CYTMA|nr:Polyamine N-acetyltransferase 1 [Valsa mali var. pyri (nom. inval.)]
MAPLPDNAALRALKGGHVNDASDDAAIDDTDDVVDDEFADLARTLSAKRREGKEKGRENRIQEIVPFPFAPNIRPLGISDLKSVIALENAAFPDPNHRATPEKFEYRLTMCPELSLGIFCTVVPSLAKGFDIETFATAHTVETDRADQAKSVLLAHIVATASNSKTVQDSDMAIPSDWRTSRTKDVHKGHVEGGNTICLHSLAVSPKLQGCGLGKLAMKSFMQQMKGLGTERVALICQDYLVSYYERFGFKHAGKSKAEFGGGGWHDMVFDLPTSLATSGPAQSSK